MSKLIKDILLGTIPIPQEPPRYWGYYGSIYQGGYAAITRCTKCFNTGLKEDCHPVKPCRHCGGEIQDHGAGKWVPPVYKGILWWKKEVTKGYWSIRG